MACPVHILSRNRELVSDLLQNGFKKGMIPAPPTKLHHAGIYSVFMHALISLDSSLTTLPKIYHLGLPDNDK
jgi:hypothetical protein